MEAHSTAMKTGPATPLSHIDVKLSTACKYGIWTGGADARHMEAVQATAITGGLRFWTAALIRANGGWVCTGEGNVVVGCTVQRRELGSCCDLCRIFGCTGLSRSFNLSVDDKCQPSGYEKGTVIVKLDRFRDKDQKPPRYYLTKGYSGPVTLHLVLRRPPLGQGLPREALAALYLMVMYGTIGSYDQYGCGLVRFATQDGERELRSSMLAGVPKGQRGSTEAPGLDDFFFAKGRLGPATIKEPDRAICEIRFQVREAVRALKGADTALLHWFCGSLKEPSGTNLCLTVEDDGTLRAWGHFSRNSRQFGKFREEVLNAVKRILEMGDYCGDRLYWRECDSNRDSKGRMSWAKFYESLVSDQEWRKL